MHPEGPGIRAT